MGLTLGEEEFGCGCVKPQREGMVLLSAINVFPHREEAVPRLLRRWWGHGEPWGDRTAPQTWQMPGEDSLKTAGDIAVSGAGQTGF